MEEEAIQSLHFFSQLNLDRKSSIFFFLCIKYLVYRNDLSLAPADKQE
jgi:hypothetical protein